MKVLFLLFVLFIGTALLYKFVTSDDLPVALKLEISRQANPFTVVKDSQTIVWRRAQQLLEGRKHLLAGGERIQTDSTLFLPYYNDNRKGNSILIERKEIQDSVLFKVSWWHSRNLTESGSKEIALFMQRGISRYGEHF